MYKYLLENAGDINWMALLALVTFVTVFLLGSVTALSRRKSHFQHMANLPLEDDDQMNS